MRDARPRIRQAADWRTSRVFGTGQAVCVGGEGEDNYRVASANTIKLLLPVRQGAG